MAACEKCWADAYGGGYEDQTIRYALLIKERDANPCTPEQQCGDMHLVLDFDDGKHCRCGQRVVE